MHLHSHPVAISCIWETLRQIKIFHLLADESTSMESVHNRILVIFKFKAGTVLCTSCAKSEDPHNSKVGSVIFLTRATLDLEQSNLVITFPC
jgi:hypothetical protein